MSKNIAIDLSWIKPEKSGGVENHTINLIKYFKNQNILYFVNPNILRDTRYSWLPKENVIILSKYYWVNIIYIFFFSFNILNKKKIKVFFSTNIYCPLFISKKIKKIITLHHAMWIKHPQFYSLLKILIFEIYYRLLRDNTRFIAISNYIKNAFKNKFKYKNIKVIYNPIVVKNYNHTNIREKKKFFFYLAANESHKNITTIVNAFKNKELKKYNLIIAGYGQPKLKIAKNINFLGKINERKKFFYIKNCHCYIHPSLYEGFGMPLVEAMLLKKNIITTKRGAIPEITFNKAIYVSRPEIEKTWINVINNFNKLKFQTININKIKNMYDPKKIYNKYKKIITNI